MRGDITQAFEDVWTRIRSGDDRAALLDNTLRSFMEGVNNQFRELQDKIQYLKRGMDARDQILIEYNPINRMYQWTCWPKYSGDFIDDYKPYAEGRSDTYEEALAAVIYHENLHRLGLPTKPNGVTKNY